MKSNIASKGSHTHCRASLDAVLSSGAYSVAFIEQLQEREEGDIKIETLTGGQMGGQ